MENAHTDSALLRLMNFQIFEGARHEIFIQKSCHVIVVTIVNIGWNDVIK